jgi:hypothetical protein
MKNPRLVDITGMTFGNVTALRQDGNHANGAAMWLAVCSCGKQMRSKGTDLRLGKILSCGHDRETNFRSATVTHHQSNTRLYQTWKNMKARCTKPNKYYSSRGISLTESWHKFENFQEWALLNGYDDTLTIERVDVNRGYEPSNCTWIPKSAQAVNRRNIPRAENGTPWLTIARNNGIPAQTYRDRMHAGWSREDASSRPVRKRVAR